MRELSIKIKIADREYPMTVKADEEERIRKAGKLINERLKSYREKFGIDDKQDLLSMVAFDALIDRLSVEDNRQGADESVLNKIKSINQLISQSI
ncbi:cell division protein ZapA [Marivirga sp. S37H4]|uniref:Cell division protein ZapA n=1 Tax=Marivirga aurantiaca TaxID=2802615 RepID=A0A934WY30_9BACT|nr:cell division protein ZapA [Marivirga aurantiaca]MBK6264997.1 cell division protein ZapA [Marivirga aurantiaca]